MSIQEEYFSNALIIGFCIRDKNEFLFIAQEPKEYPDPFERAEFIYVTYINGQWKRTAAAYTLGLYGGGYTSVPDESWVLVTYFGGVLRFDENKKFREWEGKIPAPPGEDEATVVNVNVIAGQLYAVSDLRVVWRRDGINKWTHLNNGIPEIANRTVDGALQEGFNLIDGFSDCDIYAAGGYGDLWHWDGNIWHQIDIPTNAGIRGLCCGGDGMVYLSTDVSTFLVGKGSQWEIIKYDLDEKFYNMVWFKDRVYMGSGCTLYEIKEGKFQESSLNEFEEKPADVSYIVANQDIMLMGSRLEVATYDGAQFETIIPFKFGGEE